jgi:hypothetical protein
MSEFVSKQHGNNKQSYFSPAIASLSLLHSSVGFLGGQITVAWTGFPTPGLSAQSYSAKDLLTIISLPSIRQDK